MHCRSRCGLRFGFNRSKTHWKWKRNAFGIRFLSWSAFDWTIKPWKHRDKMHHACSKRIQCDRSSRSRYAPQYAPGIDNTKTTLQCGHALTRATPALVRNICHDSLLLLTSRGPLLWQRASNPPSGCGHRLSDWVKYSINGKCIHIQLWGLHAGTHYLASEANIAKMRSPNIRNSNFYLQKNEGVWPMAAILPCLCIICTRATGGQRCISVNKSRWHPVFEFRKHGPDWVNDQNILSHPFMTRKRKCHMGRHQKNGR